MKYYLETQITGDFDEIVARTKEVLTHEGFGVLTEIDIQEKLKEKLDVDYSKYIILGACNPPFAYQALQQEVRIGTMLPCNVIVRQLDEETVEVASVDPIASMLAVENETLAGIALAIREKLRNVIDSL